LIANEVLGAIPELETILLPVDISDHSPNTQGNISTMKNIFKILKNGGLIGMFPAGEVAVTKNIFSQKVQELPWSWHLGRIVLRSQATVVPVYFHGQTGMVFQRLGHIWPQLRIPLLVREFLNSPKTIQVDIGEPISFAEMKGLKAKEVTEFLRHKTLRINC
jgi:putative hemolysin